MLTRPQFARGLGTTVGLVALSRLARAEPKAMRFGNAAELAIRIHWALYPESKPKGKSDAEALKDALYILQVRKEKWFAAPWQADKRMGASSLAEWQEQVRFAGLQDPIVPERIKDASTLFTDELIDEVNKFDRGAIEAQARALAL